jgi:hypothetical protein
VLVLELHVLVDHGGRDAFVKYGQVEGGDVEDAELGFG